MSELIVIDNRKELGAVLGPETEYYVFDDIEKVFEEFPSAVLKEEMEVGDPLESPIVIRPE